MYQILCNKRTISVRNSALTTATLQVYTKVEGRGYMSRVKSKFESLKMPSKVRKGEDYCSCKNAAATYKIGTFCIISL